MLGGRAEEENNSYSRCGGGGQLIHPRGVLQTLTWERDAAQVAKMMALPRRTFATRSHNADKSPQMSHTAVNHVAWRAAMVTWQYIWDSTRPRLANADKSSQMCQKPMSPLP